MCGENEKPIRVYTFNLDGMGGCTHDSIQAVLYDVQTELENWTQDTEKPITLTIKTGFMKQSEYDALPEFEGY